MHKGREARLERLLRQVNQADRAAIDRRAALLARAAIGAAVRCGLLRMGIDPAGAVMLRVADEAAAELAAAEAGLPGAPPAAADGQPPTADVCWLDDGTKRLVERYRSGALADPDLARASLAELFAWCIARADSAGPTQGCDVCC